METQSEIRLTGLITLSDVLKFQYYHSIRRQWPTLTVPVIGIVGLIALGIAYLADPSNPRWDSTMKDLTPFLFVVVILPLMVFGPLYWSARKQFIQSGYLHEPVHFEFGPETLFQESSQLTARTAWTVYSKVRETKSLFLLYQKNNVCAILIPKRFFSNGEDLNRWRQLVTACLGPKGLKRPGLLARFF